jgi:hypothetical protein
MILSDLQMLAWRLERVIKKTAGRDEIDAVHRELRELLRELIAAKGQKAC